MDVKGEISNGELAKPPILEDSRNVLNLVFNLKIEKSKLSNTFNIILKNVQFWNRTQTLCHREKKYIFNKDAIWCNINWQKMDQKR